MMMPQIGSDLERAFDTYLAQLAPHLPPPAREVRFDSVRRWRFDRGWPDRLVAVELEGGAWQMGRHQRPQGFAADCEKYNAAALAGWVVLRFTAQMLENDPAGCVAQVAILITSRSPATKCVSAGTQSMGGQNEARTTAPPPFVNETISQIENRLNVALFGLMTIPRIRTWLLDSLALPVDSIIYPPVRTCGLRPDFVVVGPDDTVLAWIEVETGEEDSQQLAAYRKTFHEPIKSIVGLDSYGGDVSLEMIASAIDTQFVFNLDRQQIRQAIAFTTLVRSLHATCPVVCGSGICGLPVLASYDYCKLHQTRYQRHGDPTIILKRGRKRKRRI